MHAFPRPQQQYLEAERCLVEGICPECAASELADYRVLSEGGWWDVRKCGACLASVERQRAPRYGSFVPLGLQV